MEAPCGPRTPQNETKDPLRLTFGNRNHTRRPQVPRGPVFEPVSRPPQLSPVYLSFLSGGTETWVAQLNTIWELVRAREKLPTRENALLFLVNVCRERGRDGLEVVLRMPDLQHNAIVAKYYRFAADFVERHAMISTHFNQ